MQKRERRAGREIDALSSPLNCDALVYSTARYSQEHIKWHCFMVHADLFAGRLHHRRKRQGSFTEPRVVFVPPSLRNS